MGECASSEIPTCLLCYYWAIASVYRADLTLTNRNAHADSADLHANTDEHVYADANRNTDPYAPPHKQATHYPQYCRSTAGAWDR